jgi:hypothetical protein
VTLEEVGTNVVATGSGPLDLTGLTPTSSGVDVSEMLPFEGLIITGPASGAAVEEYNASAVVGPTSFGSGSGTLASSGSGDLVGGAADGFAFVVPASA